MKFKSYEEEKKYFEEFASEAEFIEWYHKQEHAKYEKPSVTIDLVALRYFEEYVQLLLVQRKRNPGRNKFALVGGFVTKHEDILAAGVRECAEETGIKVTREQLKQLPAWAKPNRDPRGWVITNPLVIQFKGEQNTNAIAADDAKNAIWFDLDELPENMYADHAEIIEYALDTVRSRVKLQGLKAIKNLLPPQFTMKDVFNILQALKIKVAYNNLARTYKHEIKRVGTKVLGRGKPVTVYVLK